MDILIDPNNIYQESRAALGRSSLCPDDILDLQDICEKDELQAFWIMDIDLVQDTVQRGGHSIDGLYTGSAASPAEGGEQHVRGHDNAKDETDNDHDQQGSLSKGSCHLRMGLKPKVSIVSLHAGHKV